MRRPAFTTPRRARALWPVLACLLIVFVYYIVPLAADRTLPFRILGALAAIVALGTVALRQLTSAEQRVGRLVTLLVLVVVCCSAAFYSLASTPGQMEGLVTRTDALYFTVITTATIGYGDIYPVGQAARPGDRHGSLQRRLRRGHRLGDHQGPQSTLTRCRRGGRRPRIRAGSRRAFARLTGSGFAPKGSSTARAVPCPRKEGLPYGRLPRRRGAGPLGGWDL